MDRTLSLGYQSVRAWAELVNVLRRGAREPALRCALGVCGPTTVTSVLNLRPGSGALRQVRTILGVGQTNHSSSIHLIAGIAPRATFRFPERAAIETAQDRVDE